EHEDDQGPQRRPGGHGRAVPGGQGAPRRLLPLRLREPRARDGHRHALARRPLLGGRAAAPDGRGRGGHVTPSAPLEDLLRGLAPQVLGALVRRHGGFDACEDAVQDALLDAAVQWREQGVPESPRGWLITVASRRLIDRLRSEQARRRREEGAAAQVPPDLLVAPAPGHDDTADEDDTLTLLFLCCHPALLPPSQIALTLRAVGGLTTAEIASAFLVPEATMGQRISRAKQTIKNAGARFEMPHAAERAERLRVV